MIENQNANKSKNIENLLLSLFLMTQIYAFYGISNFFLNYGYLPSPFLLDKSDTFMDLFNSIFWADNEGKYSDWKSVYPPLNFILLSGIKLVFLGGQSFTNAFSIRQSGLSIEIFFVIAYLLLPILVLKTTIWKDFSILNKSLLYFAFILSSPMLFTLERGNVIIITLIFLALAISHSGMYRCMFIAFLINIKPYFFVLTFLFLIKNESKEFLLCVGAAAIIFIITGLVLDKNFLLFFENILNFSNTTNLFSLHDIISLPSSMSAYSAILNSEQFQNSNFVKNGFLASFGSLKFFSGAIEFAKWSIIGVALVILFTANKKLSEVQVITVLVVLISNLGISVGGYTLILYFTLIPIFWTMRFKWAYLAILALIYTSATVFLLSSYGRGIQYSYLSDAIVSTEWTIDIINLIKPTLNIVLLILLSYEAAYKKSDRSA